MRWYGRKILSVDGIIPAGERRDPPGQTHSHIPWCYTQNHDRAILRLDGDYVCAVSISKIKQYELDSRQLLSLVETAVKYPGERALACPGKRRCHGRLHACECCGDVLDVCDVGDLCEHHGVEARQRRIDANLAWLDSLG